MKKNFIIDVPYSRLLRTVLPLALLLCAGGALVGAWVVDRLVMPRIVGVNSGDVDVPAIEGLEYETARQKLYEIGLIGVVRNREFHASVAAGCVIGQSPTPGTTVKKGRQVDVIMSKGAITGTLPRVRNLSERLARNELTRNGFEVGKVRRQYSEEVGKDLVISTSPEEGHIVSRELSVEILLSNGPRPTHAEVPNVIGDAAGSGRQKLEESGLTVGKIEYRNNPSLDPGTILSQSEPPGKTVPLESAIDLVVSVKK